MVSPRELAGEPPEDGMKLLFLGKPIGTGNDWKVESAKWVKKSECTSLGEISLEGYGDWLRGVHYSETDIELAYGQHNDTSISTDRTLPENGADEQARTSRA